MWNSLRFSSITSIIASGSTIAQECTIDLHLLAFWCSDAFIDSGQSTAFAAVPGDLSLEKQWAEPAPLTTPSPCTMQAHFLQPHCASSVMVVRMALFLAGKVDIKECTSQRGIKN